ncbi:AAA family ATPase, partial [uncultured Megasphaera sp.]
MKIIQMNLDDFGIYHNVEWNPPETGLIVMHGHNESGKTTLMKYVRSMFFGYLRGDWKGFFGHMDIRRDDGREYRIYRKEKESYMTDGQLTLHDEPADLWWHGLDRQTYDKIFA